jgi:hypothetical protein
MSLDFIGRTSVEALIRKRYVMCDGMIDGELAHSCSHGPPPHDIKVCLLKKDNRGVWPIVELALANTAKRMPRQESNAALELLFEILRKEASFRKIGLTSSAAKVLTAAGYTSPDDLTNVPSEQLKKLRGIGRTSLAAVQAFCERSRPTT